MIENRVKVITIGYHRVIVTVTNFDITSVGLHVCTVIMDILRKLCIYIIIRRLYIHLYAYAHIMDTPKLEAEIDDRPTGFRLSIGLRVFDFQFFNSAVACEFALSFTVETRF